MPKEKLSNALRMETIGSKDGEGWECGWVSVVKEGTDPG